MSTDAMDDTEVYSVDLQVSIQTCAYSFTISSAQKHGVHRFVQKPLTHCVKKNLFLFCVTASHCHYDHCFTGGDT